MQAGRVSCWGRGRAALGLLAAGVGLGLWLCGPPPPLSFQSLATMLCVFILAGFYVSD